MKLAKWTLAIVLPALLSGVLFAQDTEIASDTSATADAADKVTKAADSMMNKADSMMDKSDSMMSKADSMADADPSFVFRMSNNKFIQGVPVEMPTVDVYILGTKVPVPMDALLGIRFPQTEDGKASIALKNGDVYTGTVDIPEVRLAVDWGEAKIKRGMLRSMVKTNNLYWQLKDTPAGSKWFLGPKTQ